MKNIFKWVPAAMLIACLAFVGCGGDEDGGGESGSEGSENTEENASTGTESNVATMTPGNMTEVSVKLPNMT